MQDLEKSLLHFLGDDAYKVAVLKGQWGVGKTYYWRTFLEKHKNKLDFRAYSYVSLFGSESISEVKRAVFSNFDVLNADKTSDRFVEFLKPIAENIKKLDIPYYNPSQGIGEWIENKIVDNFLICFDDLERKEKNMSASSVLGLISTLKEEKNCKILLIFNEDELDENSRADINDYREKVVDLELTYDPTISDNLTIIWGASYHYYLLRIFRLLNLNNIRIMQRVKWAEQYFLNNLERKYSTNLIDNLLYQSALLSVIHYSQGEKLTIERLSEFTAMDVLFLKEKADSEEGKFLKLLDYYKTKYDQIILDYLANGYVDFERYKYQLERIEKDLKLLKIEQDYNKIWDKFKSNFQVNENEFISELHQFVIEHFDDMGQNEIYRALRFIKDVKPIIDIDDLSESYLTKFPPHESMLKHYICNLKVSSGTEIKIRKLYSEKERTLSLSEIFEELSWEEDWRNLELIIKFSEYSEEEIYQWILEEKRTNFLELLEKFVYSLTRVKDGKIIFGKIKFALKKIEQRSEFDKKRLQYLTIDLDEYFE
ncbi:MAG: hypothetical protein H6667_12440 [Ardenticatenaceae bacterium]|nr:hypothetical protein [Ardenticatenaceae bacterium]MCB9443558.1 hypothetical protein [Ardenticatenaceae bacterium]